MLLSFGVRHGFSVACQAKVNALLEQVGSFFARAKSARLKENTNLAPIMVESAVRSPAICVRKAGKARLRRRHEILRHLDAYR